MIFGTKKDICVLSRHLVELSLQLGVGGSRGVHQLSSGLGLLHSVLVDLLREQVLW